MMERDGKYEVQSSKLAHQTAGYVDIHPNCGTLVYSYVYDVDMTVHPSGCHKRGLVLVAGLLNLPVFAQHLWPFPEIPGSARLDSNEETQEQHTTVAEPRICSISSGTFLPPRFFNRARRPDCSASTNSQLQPGVWICLDHPATASLQQACGYQHLLGQPSAFLI